MTILTKSLSAKPLKLCKLIKTTRNMLFQHIAWKLIRHTKSCELIFRVLFLLVNRRNTNEPTDVTLESLQSRSILLSTPHAIDIDKLNAPTKLPSDIAKTPQFTWKLCTVQRSRRRGGDSNATGSLRMGESLCAAWADGRIHGTSAKSKVKRKEISAISIIIFIHIRQ